MAFTTPNTAGGTVTLKNGDKITFAGQELIVNGIGPYCVGLRTRRPPPATVACTANLFTGFNGTTLAPEYGSSLSIRAQFKADTTEEENLWEDDDGPDIPHTRKVAYLQEGNASADWPHVRVVLRDKVRGLMFGGLYTVSRVTTTQPTAEQMDAGEPGSATPTPIVMACKKVDLSEQFDRDSSGAVKCGDACIIVERSQVTEAQLTGADYFTIKPNTPSGATAIKYTIWNERGVRHLQTYHYKIYLQRMK